MKSSLYNWSVTVDGNAILFNGFTGAIVELDANHFHIVELLEGENAEIHNEQFSTDEIDFLKHSGMIIEDDFDERYYLETCMNELKYGKTLTLTAVVTRQCNFNCTYCSQSEYAGGDFHIDQAVKQKVMDLIHEVKPQHVHTTLYGGEPLLYPDSCIELLSSIRDTHPKSTSSIVTNGYLLTESIAEELATNGVTGAQITVDGPEHIHNLRRMLKCGKGTYRRILENLERASKHLRILIRVNIDSDSKFDYPAFRKELTLNDNIRIYRAPTTYDHKNDLQRSEENLKAIQEQQCPEETHFKKLHARFPGCAANSLLNAVILPEGKLVRCWNQVQSPEDSHDISRLGLIASFRKWSEWNPFSSQSPCRECKMLPTCGGGCTDKYFKTGKTQCRYTETTYKQHIENNYRLRATGNANTLERRENETC